jgi:DNA polymerase-3 subunit alpha
LEKIIQYGHQFQDEQNSSQVSLFGDLGEVELPDPEIPYAEPWTQLETLKKENEVVGFYLSGHPLDQYKIEMREFANSTIKRFEDVRASLNHLDESKKNAASSNNPQLNKLKALKEKSYSIACIISNPASTNMMTKTGKPYGRFIVEDYTGSLEISMFGDNFEKYKNILSRRDQYILLRVMPDKPTWREDGDYELKVISVELLSEVLEKRAKRLDVNIDLVNLSSHLVEELKQMIYSNAGKTAVTFNIRNSDNEIVHLIMREARVNAREFILAGRANSDLNIRVIK